MTSREDFLHRGKIAFPSGVGKNGRASMRRTFLLVTQMVEGFLGQRFAKCCQIGRTRALLQQSERSTTVGRVFGIDQFRQNEIAQFLRMSNVNDVVMKSRRKRSDVVPADEHHFVTRSREKLSRLNDEKNVQKTRLDHTRMERRVLLLENDRHDVVADVSFALDLTRIVSRVGQQRADMKHDLFLVEHFVIRIWTIGLFADI